MKDFRLKNMIRIIFLSLLLTAAFGMEVVDQTVEENHEHEENEQFHFLLNQSNSTDERLSLSGLTRFLAEFNDQCLRADDVFEAFCVNSSLGLDQDQFANASSLIAFYLSQSSQSCNLTENSFLQIATERRMNFLGTGDFCSSNISILINALVQNEKFQLDQSSTNCFSSASILPRCTDDPEKINDALMTLLILMYRGFCLLPDPQDFLSDLSNNLNSDGRNFTTLNSFKNMLQSFNIGEIPDDDDHDDDHDHENEESHGDEHAHENEENHNHVDDDHDHSRRKRDTHESFRTNLTSKCFSAREMLEIVGSARDNGSLILTEDGLKKICPAILQQVVTRRCIPPARVSDPGSSASSYTTAQKYGYGTASVLVLSLLALIGLLLFPAVDTAWCKLLMTFLVALGVGTLSGDAILHVIPEVVGLHQHGEEGDDHDHDHEEDEDKSYLYKLLVVIVGIYIFYLLENIIRFFKRKSDMNIASHLHTNGERHLEYQNGYSQQSKQNEKDSESSYTDVVPSDTNNKKVDDMESSISDSESEKSNKFGKCFGVTTVGLIVFIGDILHNCGDGLAIGVAYSVSPISGLSTTIAIFCHELPHEFGDFAVYLDNGLSKAQALLFNFIAACAQFIGLYIGLGVGEFAGSREWILAIVAGMFLYISLVDILHEMMRKLSRDNFWKEFILQNLGLWLGWAILLVIAIYEEKISTSLR